MTCSARIVLIDHDHPPRPTLLEDPEASGCPIEPLDPGDNNVKAVHAHGANIVIIKAGDSPEAALGTARALKADSLVENVPIILLGDAADGALDAAFIDGVIDDSMPGESLKSELSSHIRSLTRLNVMQSELARRENVERRYGLSPAPIEPVGTQGMRILAAGDFGAETDALSKIVGDDSHLSMVEDPHLAIDELGGGEYEAAVIAVNGAADLLQRPVNATNLRAHMDMLIKQQRYRGRMQEAYRRSLHIETSDNLTGLYNFGFLHDYLAELITIAHRWQRPVSIGMFDVTGMDAINQRHGYAADDRLLRQVGGLVGRLVRGEDLTARFSGEEICVVMPETSSDIGAQVLRRIVDVVMMTEFGIVMDEAPITIGFKLGCTGLETGDTSESLLARAHAALG